MEKRLLIILGMSFSWSAALDAAEHALQAVEVLSEPYTIDRKYESMEGPESQQPVVLLETAQPELLWIRGGRVELVGPDGQTPRSGEFLCHSSLRLDTKKLSVEAHNKQFGKSTGMSKQELRLLGFAGGYPVAKFPEGFGVPVLSDEPLLLLGMFLNQNAEEPVRLRFKWTIEFVRDRDLQQPMKPLFPWAFAVHVSAEHGLRYHWRVPPGREVRRYRIPHEIVPYDTTIHYMRAHLHAFGESVALRDVTTDTTLFTSHATSYPDRVGIARVEIFSSAEGLPVYKDHAYELVSVYRNTSATDQPAMAIVRFFYLWDREFQKPRR